MAKSGSEAPGRRVCFDLHNSVGFFSSLFLLMFAVTGAYMAFQGLSVPATYELAGSKPLPEDPPLCPGRLRSQRINALRIASEYLPAAIPLWVVMPEEKTTSYLVKMRFPEDHSSNGASIAWVDQFSGKVLGAWNSRTAPLGRRIERTNRDIPVETSGDTLAEHSRASCRWHL